MYSFSLHQFRVEKWDFKAILTSNLWDVTKMQFVSGLTVKYKFNTNNIWTILCFMLFFVNNLVWVYFQFGPPCSAFIDLVAMKRKLCNIIQYKDILDPPFHYNNGCTFKWFLEHNKELVCVQTLMPMSAYLSIYKLFTFSRVLKYFCRYKSDW